MENYLQGKRGSRDHLRAVPTVQVGNDGLYHGGGGSAGGEGGKKQLDSVRLLKAEPEGFADVLIGTT